MIEAQNLYKSFGSKNAVNGVSFEVQKGQSAVILGPNGAGKTTILRLLSSLLTPDSGAAHINGFHTVKQAWEVRNSIGVLTELPGLYSRMTLQEYLLFFGRMYGVNDARLHEKIRMLSRIADLHDVLHHSIESYSKGMRQKASLLRALIHDPDVLLLDEPTSALDPKSAKSIRDYLLSLLAEGKTLLVCTHNLYEAETLATWLFVLKKGNLLFSGTTENLKKKFHQRHFKARFHLMDNAVVSAQHIEDAINKLSVPVEIKELTQSSLVFMTQNAAQTNPPLLRFLSGTVSLIACEEILLPLEQAYLSLDEDDERQNDENNNRAEDSAPS